MSRARRFYCDDETGEVVTYAVNDETGEPLDGLGPPRSPEPLFEALRQPGRQKSHFKLPNGYGYNSQQVRALREKILTGSNKVSHRMLLIPTVVFFPGLFSILLAILEIYLHVWCHRLNKNLMNNTTMYYRSPFHMVTSIFCGVCRENNSCWKVGQLQDRRRSRYGCLQGMVI